MLIETWTAWMIHGAWQALAASAVILLAVAAGRRWPARLREGLLAVATIKFLVPPFISAPTAALPLAAAAALSAAGTSGPPTAVDTGAGGEGWLMVLLALYAAGVIVMAAGAARALLKIRRWRAGSTPAPQPLSERTRTLADRIGLWHAPELLVSADVAAPMAVGVFRPAVLLPGTVVESLSPAQLDAILIHELAHHRRVHLAWSWLRAAMCALWWWHPAAWIVARQLRRVQEEVCDDEVLRSGSIPRETYGELLVRVAAITQPALTGGASFADRLHPLGARLRRLLGAGAPARGWPALNSAAVLMVAVLLLPGAMPSATQAPVTSPEPWPEEPSVVTALTGIADMIDADIDSLLSVLSPTDSPRENATGADTRERIAGYEAGRVYETLINSGAPETVTRNVSRSISQSIREKNRRFWRDLARGAARLFR